jgi:23S rRNA (uracil1939-C5)-methyltransferase
MRTKKQPILEAAITRLAYGGRGIAKLNGMAVFVDQTIPGDRALIQIARRRKNYAEARLVKILEPSPDRVTAPCRYSGICGGCTWQFVRHQQQLEYKRLHVAECLEHLGGIKGIAIHPAYPSLCIFEYRNKMEFACADRRWLLPEELADPAAQKDFGLGLHVPGAFNKVIDIRECLLQPSLGNRILEHTRQFIKSSGRPVYNLRNHEGFWRFVMLRNSTATGRWMVNLVTAHENREVVLELAERLIGEFPEIGSVVNNVSARKAGIAVGEFERPVAGEATIREAIGKLEFEISANSFFQTNTRAAERLYETVKAYAGLDGRQTVLDLYSGTGTIPIILSGECREVIGIEIVPSAVADARTNCRLNGISNCRFIQGDIQDCLPTLDVRPDVMIIDPPRAGMSKEVVGEVLALAPSRMVYVSCNPATLARDLAMLVEAYEIMEVQPIDLFPHTFHIESVVRLERRGR